MNGMDKTYTEIRETALWLIILVKLFVMFAILKVFFFPDFLKGKSEAEKEDFVGTELVNRKVQAW